MAFRPYGLEVFEQSSNPEPKPAYTPPKKAPRPHNPPAQPKPDPSKHDPAPGTVRK